MAKPNRQATIVLSGYHVTGWIGKGSFSEVYEGVQKVSGGKVAIKVISKKNLTKGKVDDIVSEIGIMKSLDHSNIVRMLDFKWDERNVYIVLEYCEGGNLLEYIKRLLRLPESICKRAIQQLAMGLAYLRLKEITHMDLKPQNLLIKFKPFTVKIADFGLSQYLSEEVYMENIRGSPLYMAPEVLLKKRYNYKVDLWSVGVILYECLFGSAPFSNKNCKQLISLLEKEVPIKYPTSVAVTEECMNLLQGLLKYNPQERMNFDDFFNHPFVDLVHAPTEENRKIAIHILHEAVKYDEQKKYPEAFSTYCRALRYMVPILHSLKDSLEWNNMHLKVMQCLSRAEELKVILTQIISQEDIEKCLESDLKPSEDMQKIWQTMFNCPSGMDLNDLVPSTLENRSENNCKPTSSNQSSSSSKGSSKTPVAQNVYPHILSRQMSDINHGLNCPSGSSSNYLCLKDLFQSTPKVQDAIEIGSTGQMYMAEGDYNLAYEKFEASLNILIPHLKKEPPSPRKDILVCQVQWWLTQAESAKALDAASKIDAEINIKQKLLETTENCSIQ